MRGALELPDAAWMAGDVLSCEARLAAKGTGSAVRPFSFASLSLGLSPAIQGSTRFSVLSPTDPAAKGPLPWVAHTAWGRGTRGKRASFSSLRCYQLEGERHEREELTFQKDWWVTMGNVQEDKDTEVARQNGSCSTDFVLTRYQNG